MKINIISSTNKQVKQGYFNIITGGKYELNKRILETKYVSLLLDPEPSEKDFMSYKNSGLNQVLAKLAKKRNVGIGFSLSRFNNLNKLDKANLLGKILQNIMLCNKYKVKYYIVRFINYNNNDINALALSLGIKKVNII